MHDVARLRASDEDREKAADTLRRHCGAGRLTVDELDERLGAAFAARTLGELAELLDDLPGAVVAPAPQARPAPAYDGLPGRLSFSTVSELATDPATTRAQALEYVAPLLASHGYRLEDHRPDGLSFLHRHRPAWTIVVAICAFPFGLLALLITDEDRVDLDFAPGPRGGTRLLARGVAPLQVRRAFAELRD